ncbi:MAG: hypothetical protein FWE48_03985 [Coriobacteriia bacterium]|nr:hypothetical protein [Coriobacteriia bacterium]
MRHLDKTDRKQALKSNNIRALVIHFILSLVGLALFSLLLFVLPSDLTNACKTLTVVDFLPWIISIAVMSLAYVYCGYTRLKLNKEKASLSVVWLSCITVAYGILLALAFLGVHIADSVLGDGHPFSILAVLYIPLGPLFNSLSFGVASLADFALDTQTSSTVQQALMITLFPLTAILPPALLCLGLQLQKYFPRKESERESKDLGQEWNEHEGEGDGAWSHSAIGSSEKGVHS